MDKLDPSFGSYNPFKNHTHSRIGLDNHDSNYRINCKISNWQQGEGFSYNSSRVPKFRRVVWLVLLQILVNYSFLIRRHSEMITKPSTAEDGLFTCTFRLSYIWSWIYLCRSDRRHIRTSRWETCDAQWKTHALQRKRNSVHLDWKLVRLPTASL